MVDGPLHIGQSLRGSPAGRRRLPPGQFRVTRLGVGVAKSMQLGQARVRRMAFVDAQLRSLASVRIEPLTLAYVGERLLGRNRNATAEIYIFFCKT